MNCFPIIPSSSLQAVSTGKRWGRGFCFFFFPIFGLFASDFNYPLKENKKGSHITVTATELRASHNTQPVTPGRHREHRTLQWADCGARFISPGSSACSLELLRAAANRRKVTPLNCFQAITSEKKSSLELYWFGRTSLALGRKGPPGSSLGVC